MYIQVNQENMQQLYDFTKNFISAVHNYTSNTLNEYAREDIDWYIGKLESLLESIFNPELREFNERTYSLYKAYLSVKVFDNKASAAMLYSQYLDKKAKAALLEQKLLRSDCDF